MQWSWNSKHNGRNGSYLIPQHSFKLTTRQLTASSMVASSWNAPMPWACNFIGYKMAASTNNNICSSEDPALPTWQTIGPTASCQLPSSLMFRVPHTIPQDFKPLLAPSPMTHKYMHLTHCCKGVLVIKCISPPLCIYHDTYTVHMMKMRIHFQSCEGFSHDLPAMHD